MFKWILNLFRSKTLTKENFLEFLVEHKACQPGLDWAQSQDTARDIIEKCTNVGHLHWLIGTIGGALHAEYDKKIAPFLAEYDEKKVPLLAEYKEKEAPIWAEYEKQIASLLVEHDEEEDPFLAEYYKQCAPLRDEYKEKTAPFWVKYLEKGTPFLAEYNKKRYNLAKEICTFERVQESIST